MESTCIIQIDIVSLYRILSKCTKAMTNSNTSNNVSCVHNCGFVDSPTPVSTVAGFAHLFVDSGNLFVLFDGNCFPCVHVGCVPGVNLNFSVNNGSNVVTIVASHASFDGNLFTFNTFPNLASALSDAGLGIVLGFDLHIATCANLFNSTYATYLANRVTYASHIANLLASVGDASGSAYYASLVPTYLASYNAHVN